MAQKQNTKRITELDSLRGLAALGVVLFHFTYGYNIGLNVNNDTMFNFRYGFLGVQLFFMISGFVIFMTLEKTKSAFDFIVSRFSRLYPAYWAAILLTVGITIVLNIPSQRGIYSLKQVLVNFTMLQSWFKVKDIDGAYWTLAVELSFYAILWGIFLLKRLRNIELIGVVWILISLIAIHFDTFIVSVLSKIFILKHAPLFVGGIVFYKMFKKKESYIYQHFIIAFSFFTEAYIKYSLTRDWIVVIIILSFYLFFYLFVNQHLTFLNQKTLIYFGSISYPLYLVHENVGVGIIYHLKKIADTQIFYLPIAFAFVIFLAHLIRNLIERPGLKIIRKFYKERYTNA